MDYSRVPPIPIPHGWLNRCSLDKGSEKMVQHDIPKVDVEAASQASNVDRAPMRCSGGFLNILKVLYACKRASTKPSHLKAVQELCQGKEECDVEKNSLEKSPAKREPRLP